jgi:hypothetical protein
MTVLVLEALNRDYIRDGGDLPDNICTKANCKTGTETHKLGGSRQMCHIGIVDSA